jgi:hypothetical protein
MILEPPDKLLSLLWALSLKWKPSFIRIFAAPGSALVYNGMTGDPVPTGVVKSLPGRFIMNTTDILGYNRWCIALSHLLSECRSNSGVDLVAVNGLEVMVVPVTVPVPVIDPWPYKDLVIMEKDAYAGGASLDLALWLPRPCWNWILGLTRAGEAATEGLKARSCLLIPEHPEVVNPGQNLVVNFERKLKTVANIKESLTPHAYVFRGVKNGRHFQRMGSEKW